MRCLFFEPQLLELVKDAAAVDSDLLATLLPDSLLENGEVARHLIVSKTEAFTRSEAGNRIEVATIKLQ